MGDPKILLQSTRGVGSEGKVRPASGRFCSRTGHNDVQVTVGYWTGWEEQVGDRSGLPTWQAGVSVLSSNRHSGRRGDPQTHGHPGYKAEHFLGRGPFAMFSFTSWNSNGCPSCIGQSKKTLLAGLLGGCFFKCSAVRVGGGKCELWGWAGGSAGAETGVFRQSPASEPDTHHSLYVF